jgi:1-acyl-sn-glycerol-3-phosphate acyltransferase
MTLRQTGRLLWFALEVGLAIVSYLLTVALAFPKNKRLARAGWLSRASRRHLRCFGYSAEISGEIPRHGLLVSNHLSYLDILAISAATPAVFVSKADVRQWPLFGWLAKLGGTIFIERERRTHVGAVNKEIESALAGGVLVVVFPEGTSTNGDEVLPFRSSLLEPVAAGGDEISVGYLHYELDNGDARNDVCYWGDHTFFSHAVNLLGKRRIRATLRFAKFQRTTDDRKELAKQLREAVLELKAKSADRAD